MTDLAQARAAKQHLRQALRGRSDVVGLGVSKTEDGYCVKVNVTELRDELPRTVDGVDVVVTVVGPIRAQDVEAG